MGAPVASSPRRSAAADAVRPLGYFVASRILVLACVGAFAQSRPGTGVLGLLSRWDGGWYLQVAAHGYPTTVAVSHGHAVQSSLAFLPLYSLSFHALATVTGLSDTSSALLLGFIAGAGATVLFWRFVRALAGAEIADRATLLFCLFPGTAVWSFVYAEPLMMVLAIGCIMALLRQRWLVAGVTAALASATRPNALVLAFCCLWAAIAAMREKPDWRPLVAPVLAPIGFLSYLVYVQVHVGSWTSWLRVEHDGWSQYFDGGMETVKLVGTAVIKRPANNIEAVIPSVGLVIAMLLLWCLWQWRPPTIVSVYCVALIVLSVMSHGLGLRPRFIEAAFPLFAAAAWKLRGNAFALALAVSAALLMVVTLTSVTGQYGVP